MWHKLLISLGFSAIVLASCDPQPLIAKLDRGGYEVVALIAE